MMPTGMGLTEIALGDLSPLANHLWQSTLCVVAIWLLTVVLRKNHAAVRYWLWLTASVKFLIPFSLLVGMGGQVRWRTAPAIATAIAEPHWSTVVADVGGPFTASAPAHQAVASPALNSLPGILFMVWLCGFAVSAILWLRCWREMRAVRKGAVPLALGHFDLDDYVDYLQAMLEHLGPGVHTLGVCQPAVPLIMTVALMEAE